MRNNNAKHRNPSTGNRVPTVVRRVVSQRYPYISDKYSDDLRRLSIDKIMDQMTTRQNYSNALELELHHALIRNDIPCTSQFKFPGTSYAWDIYIPTKPRAVIEIISANQIGTWSTKQRFRKKMTRHFEEAYQVGQISYFLVVFGKLTESVRRDIETIRDSFKRQVESYLIEIISPTDKEAIEDKDALRAQFNDAAVQIGECRKQGLPKLLVKFDDLRIEPDLQPPRDSDSVSQLARNIHDHGITDPLVVRKNIDGTFTILDGYYRYQALEYLINVTKQHKKTDGFMQEIPVAVTSISMDEPPNHNFEEAHPSAIMQDDAYHTYFHSLAENLILLLEGTKRPKAWNHELNVLSREFDSHHYTSCALRIGRFIELTLYTLAHEWGIELNPYQHKSIDLIQPHVNSLKTLTLALFESGSCMSNKYKKEEISKEIHIIKKELDNLIVSISDESRLKHSFTRDEQAKRPGISNPKILRQMKRNFQDENIKKLFDSLTEKKLIQKMMDFRNDAAHPHVAGEDRELQREDIEDMLENGREFLQSFINILEKTIPTVKRNHDQRVADI